MTDFPERKTPAEIRQSYSVKRDKTPQKYSWRLAEQPEIPGMTTWEWDINTQICRYSPEWANIVGTKDALLEFPRNWSWWSGRMHMDDMPLILDMHRRFFSGEIDAGEIVYRFQRPDGRWIRILSRGIVARWNKDGTPAAMSGLLIDVTHLNVDPPLPEDGAPPLVSEGSAPVQRAEVEAFEPGITLAERRFKLNERRLQSLYQLAHMGKASEDELLHFAMTSILQLTDSPGGFLFISGINPGSPGNLFWSSPGHTHLGHILLPGNALPEEIAAMAGATLPDRVKARILNGDGISPLHILFEGALPVMRCLITPNIGGIGDGQVLCFAAVCNKLSPYDESDMRQLETFVNNTWLILRRHHSMRELELAKETAETANRAKGEFIANVSHELRTPLNGILSMLQLLETFPMQDQQREFLKTARLSGNALVRIISDILDFSRIESGKMQLVKECFDFKTSILSGLQIFQEEAEKEGLEFITTIDPAIPDLLQGDEIRVRQIVFNLVDNACKFTKKGGITITCVLEPEQPPGKARIRLTVTDTGIGIPKDKQDILFSAFTQLNSFYNKKSPGTGLGLSIVKRLVTMMGGDILLKSDLGKGTSISCSLILDLCEEVCMETPSLSSADSASQGPLDVLVAEDDAVGRFALRSFLALGGHRTVCVQNGLQALEALQLYPFDCLLTDVQMPDMDGLELTRQVQSGELQNFPPPSEEVRNLVREAFPQVPDALIPVSPDIPIIAVSAHAMTGDRERFLQQGINYYISKPIIMRHLDEILKKIPSRAKTVPKP
ncbi:MAG: response regulator [Deltaproteobacteria bacterium]|jgi:signal transduction histidine kinase/DNA-binding NarL/FixJ family response regulator|nr:response regulator [Deltaproteobacteria bacterium]